MAMLSSVKLERFMTEFGRLEENIADLKGVNNLLELQLEESTKQLKFYRNKQRNLMNEKESLLLIANRLQQTVHQQCYVRVENEKLKKEVENLKEENEKTAKAGRSNVQLLLNRMALVEDRQQRALEAVKQQSSREMEQVKREMAAKDADCQRQLEEKHLELQEMKTRMKEQEREQQSELLKLQIEFGAKLAWVQSSAQRNQQQLPGSNLVPQSVYKRKLQFIQEEKNKEIAALRQRIQELEENQGAGGSSYAKMKKF